MIREIHLATGNAHKAQEMQRLADASALAMRIVAAARMPEVAEDTGTFVGNARKKAAALRALLARDAWVLADDSGVCVDELGGAPGVESAYYAGPQHDGAANLARLVEVMRGVPAGRRAAHFRCVLVLLGPEDVEQVFEGRCEGVLAFAPAGGHGFGYDPIFVPVGYDRTFGEMNAAEKHRLSHRARAFAAFARAKLGAELAEIAP